MLARLSILAAFVACAAPADDVLDDGSGGGKDDSARRFVEIDTSHTNPTFRAYIGEALDELDAHDSELAAYTLRSISDGRVRIDELSDLTCGDFLRVANDLPDLDIQPGDYVDLTPRGELTAAIANQIDGYMWSNRIYVSRGQPPRRLAATLIHEVNHVINRSEVGYYDDLPTSAFLHEYRSFYAEAQFDPEEYAGIDLVDYVITNYELDRSAIPAAILASPLTPTLLPDAAAWRTRRVEDDVEEPADCSE
jgi:hypothetical protein